MFNRTYQLRATKRAREAAAVDAANFSLPWAGLFRPKQPWRSLVILAALGERLDSDRPPFHRPEEPVRAGIAAKRCKKRSGKLQGLQLELFPDPPDPTFYRPPAARALDPERPLADVFPEAYEADFHRRER
jgi:hypothetical protein